MYTFFKQLSRSIYSREERVFFTKRQKSECVDYRSLEERFYICLYFISQIGCLITLICEYRVSFCYKIIFLVKTTFFYVIFEKVSIYAIIMQLLYLNKLFFFEPFVLYATLITCYIKKLKIQKYEIDNFIKIFM